MELVGRKITRTLDMAGKPEVSVNAVNGRISLNNTATRKTGLGKERGNTLGFAYDTENNTCYAYIDSKGVKMNELGAMTSKWHARELKQFFSMENTSFKLSISTSPVNVEGHDGMDFFQISKVAVSTDAVSKTN